MQSKFDNSKKMNNINSNLTYNNILDIKNVKKLLKKVEKKVPSILLKYNIEFAFVFGSLVNNNSKYFVYNISDIDIGFYVKNSYLSNIKSNLHIINGELVGALLYDYIDTVIMNDLAQTHPALLANIIQQGKLLLCSNCKKYKDFLFKNLRIIEDYRLFQEKMLKLEYGKFRTN